MKFPMLNPETLKPCRSNQRPAVWCAQMVTKRLPLRITFTEDYVRFAPNAKSFCNRPAFAFTPVPHSPPASISNPDVLRVRLPRSARCETQRWFREPNRIQNQKPLVGITQPSAQRAHLSFVRQPPQRRQWNRQYTTAARSAAFARKSISGCGKVAKNLTFTSQFPAMSASFSLYIARVISAALRASIK